MNGSYSESELVNKKNPRGKSFFKWFKGKKSKENKGEADDIEQSKSEISHESYESLHRKRSISEKVDRFSLRDGRISELLQRSNHRGDNARHHTGLSRPSWLTAKADPDSNQSKRTKKKIFKSHNKSKFKFQISGMGKDENHKGYIMDSIAWFSRHVPDVVMDSIMNEISHSIDETNAADGKAKVSSSKIEDDSSCKSALSGYKMPHYKSYEAVLLFVDISGFTKLSTILKVEHLSREINGYFDLICDVIAEYGGDILKFAGDALFAEWRPKETANNQALEEELDNLVLMATLCGAIIVELCSDFPIYLWGEGNRGEGELVAELNVHCGLGVGQMIGLHVGSNGRELQKDMSLKDLRQDAALQRQISVMPSGGMDAFRREYLILGDPIDQVAAAEGKAGHGELCISQQAFLRVIRTQKYRSICPYLTNQLEERGDEDSLQLAATLRSKFSLMNVDLSKAFTEPVLAASRETRQFPLEPTKFVSCRRRSSTLNVNASEHRRTLRLSEMEELSQLSERGKSPRESRLNISHHGRTLESTLMHERSQSKLVQDMQTKLAKFSISQLSELKELLCRYIHKVVIDNEDTSGKPTSLLETRERHLAEAELRDIVCIFINIKIETKVESKDEIDDLCNLLNKVFVGMNQLVVRFKGHLRQFIVDDKGCVGILTFGLRGATFANMVTERGLPCAAAINEFLEQELNIQNSVGVTLGRVYCGVVGGTMRHEYAVLGPSINLSARLMASPSNNNTIFVDTKVYEQACNGYEFETLDAINAKGYKDPVQIYEPLGQTSNLSRNAKASKNLKFVGRTSFVFNALRSANVLIKQKKSKFFMFRGESGIGKTALLNHLVMKFEALGRSRNKNVVVARKASRENELLVPFSAFRPVFLSLLSQLDESMNRVSQDEMENQSLLSSRSERLMMQRDSRRSLNFIETESVAQSIGRLSLDDVSLPSFNGSLMSSSQNNLERLRFVCKELEEVPEFADVIGKYFLGLPVDNIESLQKMPKMKSILQFMSSAFLQCAARCNLVVIALDDVHFMDALSWSLLQMIYANASNVLILGTSRPTENYNVHQDEEFNARLENDKVVLSNENGPVHPTLSHPPEGRQGQTQFFDCQLKPLTVKDTKTLICVSSGIMASDVDETLVNTFYEQTGGMPHFASEILSLCKSTGRDLKQMLDTDDASTRVSSMNQMMLYKLDSIDSETRQMIHLCSILGREFSLSDLFVLKERIRQIVPFKEFSGNIIDDIKKVLLSAVDEGILEQTSFLNEESDLDEVEDDIADNRSLGDDSGNLLSVYHYLNQGYRFRLDAFRTVVLDSMLDSRKRSLHRLVAEALEVFVESSGFDCSDYTTLLNLFRHWVGCRSIQKTAILAVVIGRDFEKIGSSHQSLTLYEQALGVFTPEESTKDGRASDKDNNKRTGGIVDEVLNSLNAKELQLLIKLKIEMGKNYANTLDGKASALRYQDAFEILKNAQASNDLEDYSMLFPIFSGLALALKWGNITDDAESSYEQELVAKFVESARKHGDPIHLARAIALQGVLLYRLGKLEDAIESQVLMDEVYDVNKHSEGICRSYGSDRAAQNYGLCTHWHELLGDNVNVQKNIDFVLDVLLPKMEDRNVHNSFMLLYPVLIALKNQGQARRAKEIFMNNVVDMFKKHYDADASTFCLGMYKPTEYLLTLLSSEETPESELIEIIDWVFIPETSNLKKDLESVVINLGRDGVGAIAEICLICASRGKKMGIIDDKVYLKLLEKGQELAKKSLEKSAGDIAYQYSYKETKPVLENIEKLIKGFENKSSDDDGGKI